MATANQTSPSRFPTPTKSKCCSVTEITFWPVTGNAGPAVNVPSPLPSSTVLLGNGDGTFTASSSSPQTGYEPAGIAAGDFNGDGILDLAVSNLNGGNPDPGSVTVLLGSGDGTFMPTAQSPVTGALPLSIAVGDFNGDGKADLVTGDAGSNTATVLLGNGDGTFAAPLNPPAGTNSLFVAVGDFNGDGLPDLAAANNTPNTVTVLLTQETLTATATVTGISPKGSGQHFVDASYKGNAPISAVFRRPYPLPGATRLPEHCGNLAAGHD
jgi:hypothetical protein